MLIRFNVKNFLSFADEENFSMEPGKVRGKREHISECRGCNLLKFSAIYGSNAAGKSNYIQAIYFAQRTILSGIPKHTMNQYHRVNTDNREKPTEFVFEIRLGKKKYRYRFSLNIYEARFLSESLVDFSTAKEKTIFYRNMVTGEKVAPKLSKTTAANIRIQTYFDDMEDNAPNLFLTEMNRNKSQAYKMIPELHVFEDVYKWFEGKLRIISPEEHRQYRPELFRDSGAESICKLLQQFGLPITETTVEPVSFEAIVAAIPGDPPVQIYEDIKNDMLETLREGRKQGKKGEIILQVGADLYSVNIDDNDELVIERLQLVHGNTGRFNISEESDGTRRLIELVDILLSEKNDVTYIVDEIDRSLHPLITKRFIELFLMTAQNVEKQLIVSTHESRLLDLSLLRKDEIWFMTKEAGVSHLQSLESMGVRPDLKIDTAYLKGKLVSIPMW